MKKRFGALAVLGLFAATLVACGGGGGTSGGGGGGSLPPPGGGNPAPPGVGPLTIGVALPDGTIGTINTTFGMIGGFTQSVYSQTLAFPTGTTITIKNLSAGTPHTLNVLSTTGFPSNPSLSTSPSGTATLDANFASGTIAPGGTVSVTLANPGTYYIGCAYHYGDPISMRDVLMVGGTATPGPQATPQPSSSSGPPCSGPYC